MNKYFRDIMTTDFPGVLHLRPRVHRDPRGQFAEYYREAPYRAAGIPGPFVQDNLVRSGKQVFRGLHFQLPPYAQAKLITMIRGRVLDVVVDLRKDSPAYLKTLILTLSAEEQDQLYIPAGLAHGYYVQSDDSCLAYKVSRIYAPGHQAGIRWDDEELGLKQYFRDPLLSPKDRTLPSLRETIEKHTF